MFDDSKAPSLQFYPKDALDLKVLRMSDAAQGIYWRLLFNIWAHTKTQFSIQNDDKALARLLGINIQRWRKVKLEIQWKDDPLFIEKDGMLISKRLKIEREKQIEWREKSRIGGLKSAKQRATTLQPPLKPKRQPRGNTSTPSSSPTPLKDLKHPASPATSNSLVKEKAEVEVVIKEVHRLGFNISQFLNKNRKYLIPELVLVVGQEFIECHESVQDPWAWFTRVFHEKYGAWRQASASKENIKKGGLTSIADLLKGGVSDGNKRGT